MAEISEELKGRLLALFEPKREHYLRHAAAHEYRPDQKRVTFPIMLDGVLDGLVYNVTERIFERLEVPVTNGGLLLRDNGETAADCKSFKVVHIPLR